MNKSSGNIEDKVNRYDFINIVFNDNLITADYYTNLIIYFKSQLRLWKNYPNSLTESAKYYIYLAI